MTLKEAIDIINVYKKITSPEAKQLGEAIDTVIDHTRITTPHWVEEDMVDVENGKVIEHLCFCSVCQERAIKVGNEYILTDYCPYCGTRMYDMEEL